MPTLTDIQRVFRDSVRFTGDGLPNEPVSAPLPTGSPRSGVHHPSKAEIRDVLIQVLQSLGNPDALDDLLAGLDGKADNARTTPSYASRAAAVSGTPSVPAAVTQILVREGSWLVIRSRTAFSDDPLFPASPQWGVVLRVPSSALLDAKADLANTGKMFGSRAGAVSVGQAGLPAALGRIITLENDNLVYRADNASGDDPLFPTPPHWGVVLRVPSREALIDLQAAVEAEAGERMELTDAFEQSRAYSMPPGTGFESARVALNSDGSMSVLDGRLTDGATIEGGLSERRVSALPPGLGYRNAEITPNNEVVQGAPSALPYPSGMGFGPDANGVQQIFAHGPNHRRQVTYGPETKALLNVDALDEARFARTTIAGQSPIGVASYLGPVVQDASILRVIIIYGQSLALGHNGIGQQYQAWLTTPQAPGKVLMLSSGINPLEAVGGGFATLVRENLGTLVDAVSVSSVPPQNNNETVGIPAAVGMMDAHDRSGRFVCVALGRGGTAISDLSKGTSPYANVMTWLDRLMDQVAAQYPGHSVEVAAVAWLHGEANGTTSAADYGVARDALFADLATDIRAKTSQVSDPLFIVGQTATLSGGATIGPAYAALDAALAGTALFLGPQYAIDGYVDASHGTPRFYSDLGVAIGHAYRDWKRSGKRPVLYATSAVRSGAVITLTFSVPEGRLMLDPRISDPGNLGLNYRDSTSSARIISARIASANTVEITLNTTPSGANPVIGIADRGVGTPGFKSGARSPLCDQTRRINPFTGAIDPIHAAMQQIAVT